MAKRKAPGSDSCTDKAFELVSLGRASYASKSAIASLLQHVDQHGVPETYDRFAQYKARKEVCRKRQGEYGPLVIDKPLTLGSGKLQTIPMQNAFAFLKYNIFKKITPRTKRVVTHAAGDVTFKARVIICCFRHTPER